MAEERNHIKVFVSSTVYDFEATLNRIFALLDGYGYDVYMSKVGTIPIDSRRSNLVNCVESVDKCDVFLGIIRPLVGSGVLKNGDRSITAQEFDRAFSLEMPRFVLADYRVAFAHNFLRLVDMDLDKIPNYYLKKETREDGSKIEIRKPNLTIHAEPVELYRLAIQNHIRPVEDRIGNWAQPFKDEEDIMRFIEFQFKDVERIKAIINGK